MKKFSFKINGNQYDVDILSLKDNLATIEVNGTAYEVELEQAVKKTKTPTIVRQVIPTKAEDIEKKPGGSSTPVKSPLPGKIMTIAVKPGDIVKKGEVLVVMEAMKMENSVLASKDGVIENIRVKPGDAVLEGDVLLEMI